jgi:hypothetical protein
MKRITSLMTAALAVGVTAFAQAAPYQPAPGAQPVDPSTQPAPSPSQQPMPGQEPTVSPSSSAPSASAPAPEESSSAPAVGPDARSGTSSAAAAAPAADPDIHLAAITPPGMSTEEACTGFKSLIECATAMHAAQNLGIPYGDLKSKLTAGRQLTAAIHDLKPAADAPAEARRAEDQARSDVRVPQG